jgi:hypothetical protein
MQQILDLPVELSHILQLRMANSCVEMFIHSRLYHRVLARYAHWLNLYSSAGSTFRTGHTWYIVRMGTSRRLGNCETLLREGNMDVLYTILAPKAPNFERLYLSPDFVRIADNHASLIFLNWATHQLLGITSGLPRFTILKHIVVHVSGICGPKHTEKTDRLTSIGILHRYS